MRATHIHSVPKDYCTTTLASKTFQTGSAVYALITRISFETHVSSHWVVTYPDMNNLEMKSYLQGVVWWKEKETEFGARDRDRRLPLPGLVLSPQCLFLGKMRMVLAQVPGGHECCPSKSLAKLVLCNRRTITLWKLHFATPIHEAAKLDGYKSLFSLENKLSNAKFWQSL